MEYGSPNNEKNLCRGEIERILNFAKTLRVRVLDTAPCYGDSEQVIGDALGNYSNHFLITTKTPHISSAIKGMQRAKFVKDCFTESLLRMHQSSVYGLLVHEMDGFLKDGQPIYDAMCELKAKKMVNKIGVSIYNCEEIERVLASYEIDLIQAPISILDQRLVRSGYLCELIETGIEVHVRSIFLKGLVFYSPQNLPPYFDGIREQLTRFHSKLHEQGITPLQAAVRYVDSLSQSGTALYGVNTKLQLEQIFQAKKCAADMSWAQEFAIDEPKYVNPSHWQL